MVFYEGNFGSSVRIRRQEMAELKKVDECLDYMNRSIQGGENDIPEDILKNETKGFCDQY